MTKKRTDKQVEIKAKHWMMLCRIVVPEEFHFSSFHKAITWLENTAPSAKVRIDVLAGQSGNKSLVVLNPLVDLDDAQGTSQDWVVRAFDQELESAQSRGRVFGAFLYGFKGQGGRGASISDIVWSIGSYSEWVNDMGHVSVLSISCDLDQGGKRKRIPLIREFMTGMVPKIIDQYPQIFGIVECERASEIAFGMEPQFENYETSICRRMQHNMWKSELWTVGPLLPFVSWVNVLSQNMVEKLQCTPGEIEARCREIIGRHHRESAFDCACIKTASGGVVVCLLPVHFDCITGSEDADFQSLKDFHMSLALNEITRWWRKRGIVM